jgi:eIF-2B alpha/beta/delta-like uncharacterized protein
MPGYLELIDAIARDKIAGAMALAIKGSLAIKSFIETAPYQDSIAFKQELTSFCHQLIKAQPSMASFLHLTSDVLYAVDREQDLSSQKESALIAADQFARRLSNANARIARTAAQVINKGHRILTHSYSGTAESSFKQAHKQGGTFTVICPEGRPALEGREMAIALSQAGIAVRLISDAAAPDSTLQADLVIFGADCITNIGIINKVGAYGVALAARENSIPLYAVAATAKFFPAAAGTPHLPTRPPDELWPAAPAGIEVVNFYSELTPLDLFAGIITELGVLSPEQALLHLAGLSCHPAIKL